MSSEQQIVAAWFDDGVLPKELFDAGASDGAVVVNRAQSSALNELGACCQSCAISLSRAMQY